MPIICIQQRNHQVDPTLKSYVVRTLVFILYVCTFFQSKRALDLYACHLGSYEAPIAAEFVLVSVSEKITLSFVKCVIEVTVNPVPRKLKTTFLSKKTDTETRKTSMTKIWIAYPFDEQVSLVICLY